TSFFLQAEDGIRVLIVTGVQTCALPISARRRGAVVSDEELARTRHVVTVVRAGDRQPRAQLARTGERAARARLDDSVRESDDRQIGRASCRERVWILVGGRATRTKRRMR